MKYKLILKDLGNYKFHFFHTTYFWIKGSPTCYKIVHGNISQRNVAKLSGLTEYCSGSELPEYIRQTLNLF